MPYGIGHMVGNPLPIGYQTRGPTLRVQTCSFGEQHLVLATETEASTVSRRAIRILLECFSVFILTSMVM